MLPIFWLETADADLAAITDYIGARNINAAATDESTPPDRPSTTRPVGPTVARTFSIA